jgi:hypothetical protein
MPSRDPAAILAMLECHPKCRVFPALVTMRKVRALRKQGLYRMPRQNRCCRVGNTRRPGGGRPLNRGPRGFGGESAELNARIRAASFQSHIESIRKLEPNNRELSYVAPKGWVPTERDVARIHEELLGARERMRGERLPDRNTLEIGPYAGESIPARSSSRDFTVQERAEIKRIGSQTGCHTCGTREPGTPSGNFFLDHQPASRLNPGGGLQRIFPHCMSCSARQGGEVTRELKRGDEQ